MDSKKDNDGSVYIPVDSWIYVEMTQLYFLGYVDSMFLSMRPWTRKSVLHMLEESQDKILKGENEEAKEILAVLLRELSSEKKIDGKSGTIYGMESAYARAMGVEGTTLRDSFHLGQTIINDYGRPYQSGFNSILGFSTLAEHGRFSLYVRGEYQHSPSGTGYSQALSKKTLKHRWHPLLRLKSEPGDDPNRSDRGAKSLPSRRGNALVSSSRPRDIGRKIRCVARTRARRSHGLVQ